MSDDQDGFQLLRDAFASYLSQVSSLLAVRLGAATTSRPLAAVPLPAASRRWFDDAEHDAPWEALAATCARTFSKEGHGTSVSWWGSALGHWFRRRGVYLRMLAGETLDRDTLVQNLTADIRAERDSTTLLALLEGVRFSKRRLEFADFSLIQPTPEELEETLQIPVNRVFYPHAITSMDRLTDHWYLRTSVVTPRRNIAAIYLDDPFGDPLRPTYSPFPAAVEAAMATVILWDWQYGHFRPREDALAGSEPWRPFEAPFVIAASDNPFERARPAPPVDTLYYEPRFDQNQIEVGERPADWYELDREQTEAFEGFIQRIQDRLHVIREVGEPWHFLETGLGFLTKGFVSEGLEQLLWHITALDALLGEKGLGLGNRLSRRLAAIYSSDNKIREKVKAIFVELYGFRNDLVHGSTFKKVAHHGHLRVARTLARVAALRMIEVLAHLADEHRTGRLAFVPNREEILESLELDPNHRLADVLRSIQGMTPAG
jgi:hypothetical protein